MKAKKLKFKLDSLEWEGGVSDDFQQTPLGALSRPLKIEEIAEVEWTVVQDNFINITKISQDTQIKYWLKISEKTRTKIREYSEDIFPFQNKDITDRYLLAYSVEGINEKYIGFTFESMLKSSKASLYVYTQAKVTDDKEAKMFLNSYLEEIYNRDLEDIEAEEDDEPIGLFGKLMSFFRK